MAIGPRFEAPQKNRAPKENLSEERIAAGIARGKKAQESEGIDRGVHSNLTLDQMERRAGDSEESQEAFAIAKRNQQINAGVKNAQALEEGMEKWNASVAKTNKESFLERPTIGPLPEAPKPRVESAEAKREREYAEGFKAQNEAEAAIAKAQADAEAKFNLQLAETQARESSVWARIQKFAKEGKGYLKAFTPFSGDSVYAPIAEGVRRDTVPVVLAPWEMIKIGYGNVKDALRAQNEDRRRLNLARKNRAERTAKIANRGAEILSEQEKAQKRADAISIGKDVAQEQGFMDAKGRTSLSEDELVTLGQQRINESEHDRIVENARNIPDELLEFTPGKRGADLVAAGYEASAGIEGPTASQENLAENIRNAPNAIHELNPAKRGWDLMVTIYDTLVKQGSGSLTHLRKSFSDFPKKLAEQLGREQKALEEAGPEVATVMNTFKLKSAESILNGSKYSTEYVNVLRRAKDKRDTVINKARLEKALDEDPNIGTEITNVIDTLEKIDESIKTEGYDTPTKIEKGESPEEMGIMLTDLVRNIRFMMTKNTFDAEETAEISPIMKTFNEALYKKNPEKIIASLEDLTKAITKNIPIPKAQSSVEHIRKTTKRALENARKLKSDDWGTVRQKAMDSGWSAAM